MVNSFFIIKILLIILFKLFKFKFENNYYQENSFKIIDKIEKIPFNQNFILSGMNLAFLGYFANRELFPKKILFHWPDGIWLKKHIEIKKIPGRDLIKNLRIPKEYKKNISAWKFIRKIKKFFTEKV